MSEASDWRPPVFVRIDVTDVTPRSAPPYGTITFTERNSRYVLAADDVPGKLLIGPLGVNYFEDGAADHEVIYLRRADMAPTRDNLARWRKRRK